MPSPILAPKIAVVGSINLDLVLRCSHLPKPGETIAASSFEQISGGKGANQAVSAARAGGRVSMIGRVGDDLYAGRLLDGLRECGIDCTSVMRTDGCESGLAFISVDEQGQNSIMFVAGANARLTPEDVDSLRQVIQASDVVLLQLEIPLPTVLRVIEAARGAETRVILDPAPAPNHFPEELLQVDLICPNQQEAEKLTGKPVETPAEIQSAAESLLRRGAKRVVITLGDQGAYLHDGVRGQLIPPYATEAIDTTAAGDAFAGALAVRWAEQVELEEAVRFGNAAGAIAASRRGAQPSLPLRAEIEQRGKTSP